jgi:hypothetical protein
MLECSLLDTAFVGVPASVMSYAAVVAAQHMMAVQGVGGFTQRIGRVATMLHDGAVNFQHGFLWQKVTYFISRTHYLSMHGLTQW